MPCTKSVDLSLATASNGLVQITVKLWLKKKQVKCHSVREDKLRIHVQARSLRQDRQRTSSMTRLALYLLLISGLLVQCAAGLEETPRTSKFEPERKSRFRNGGRTRMPKQKTSTTLFGETQRPRFGQLYPSYNPFLAKPSQSLSGNGLAERGGEFTSLTGLGGSFQSTKLPSHSSTNPPRNSEFLKGKSKNKWRKFLSKYLPICETTYGLLFAQIELYVNWRFSYCLPTATAH